MPNCERIHETVIRDIVDIITDIKDTDEVDFFKTKRNNLNYSSIASGSSNLTLVFPVIVSKAMDINTAAMISKAIERKCVTMLQILFSAISVSDAESVADYVSQFHTNLKVKNSMDVDEFIHIMDKITEESAGLVKVTDRDLYEAARADLKNLSMTLPDNVNEASLNDFKIMGSGNLGQRTIMQEAPTFLGDLASHGLQGDILNKLGTGVGNSNSTNANTRSNSGRNNSGRGTTNNTHNTTINNYNGGGRNDGNNAVNVAKTNMDMMRNQIVDTEIKKANELIPTMMIVNFVSKQKDGSAIAIDNAYIGVKAKMYAVDSMDICNRITVKNKDRNGLFNLVRATTREISFFRDFLFAIDKAKLDALSSSGRGESSKLWKVLERRSTKSKIRRTIGRTANDASAISTLVITQNEVEYLKTTESIDMTNPATVRGIMESYNLMGFVIADEAAESVDFLFDTGDDVFETLSFNHLERETSDGSYKKVVNLMTKFAR